MVSQVTDSMKPPGYDDAQKHGNVSYKKLSLTPDSKRTLAVKLLAVCKMYKTNQNKKRNVPTEHEIIKE